MIMYRGRFIPGDQTALSGTPPRHEDRSTVSSTPATSGHDQVGRRIACILIANFPLAAIVRANPDLRDRPISLIRPPSPRPAASRQTGRRADYQPHSEVQQVGALAQAAGVRSGMTVAQARALLPNLTIFPPSIAAEAAAGDALLDAAESISPLCEAGAPGCVWLDLTGVMRVHQQALTTADPEADAEQALADEIARRVHQVGLEAAIGIAANKELAQLAARCGGRRVIPPGREREFLDWLPLELADLGAGPGADERELRFRRLGIRRLGDLARLELEAIGSRMGEQGVKLARLARGEGSAIVRGYPRPELYAEAIELEYGIESLEPLGFILQGMLQRIGARLKLRGLAAGDLILSLGLADRRRDERRVPVAAPTGEVRSLLMLLRLSLEKTPPGAPVETVRLAVEPRTARPVQHDMFIPPTPAPDRLATAIARIAALCGPDRVGTILPADSYRPEAVRVVDFAPPPAPPLDIANRDSGSPGREIVPMALRTVRPAEEIEMLCRRDIPEFARGKNVCARVIAAAGPWRRHGEWWAVETAEVTRGANPQASGWQASAPSAYARDYYEIALADGGVYRMYRDHYSGKWFMDGVYD